MQKVLTERRAGFPKAETAIEEADTKIALIKQVTDNVIVPPGPVHAPNTRVKSWAQTVATSSGGTPSPIQAPHSDLCFHVITKGTSDPCHTQQPPLNRCPQEVV